MFHPARYLIVLVFVTCGLGPCSRAKAQEGQTRKSSSATVIGKVTIQGKGAPGIVVGLRYNAPGSQRALTLRATTDEYGDYRIVGIIPGSCVVAPLAPGFVVTDYSYNTPGKTILTVEGETVEDIDFALLPGGVVTGKVTDADGRPLIEERVTLLPFDPANQMLRIPPPNGTPICPSRLGKRCQFASNSI
jgi:hypothetical protein